MMPLLFQDLGKVGEFLLQRWFSTSQYNVSCPKFLNACCHLLRRERLPGSPLTNAPRILCIAPGATEVASEETHKDRWHAHQCPFPLNRAINLHHIHRQSPPLSTRNLYKTTFCLP